MLELSTEVRKITPDQAKTYLDDHNFVLQRRVKGGHVAGIAAAMKNGDFPPGSQLMFVEFCNQLTLIDGQHRLRAQKITNIPMEYTVTTYKTDSSEMVNKLYTQMDIGAKRTITDRMKALDFASQVNLTNPQAAIYQLCAPWLKYRFGRFTPTQLTEITPMQRLEILKEFEEGVIKYFAIMDSADSYITKVFNKPNFVALGAYLFQYGDEPVVTDFWSAIADNDFKKSKKDPRYQMFTYAQNATLNSNMGMFSPGQNSRLRTHTLIQSCIPAWNAFVHGKEMVEKITSVTKLQEKVHVLGVDDPFLYEPKQASLLDDDNDSDEHDASNTRNLTEVVGKVIEQLKIDLRAPSVSAG